MNPKFTKFLEENPNISMAGMCWSLFWRAYGILLAICFGLAILATLFK